MAYLEISKAVFKPGLEPESSKPAMMQILDDKKI